MAIQVLFDFSDLLGTAPFEGSLQIRGLEGIKVVGTATIMPWPQIIPISNQPKVIDIPAAGTYEVVLLQPNGWAWRTWKVQIPASSDTVDFRSLLPKMIKPRKIPSGKEFHKVWGLVPKA